MEALSMETFIQRVFFCVCCRIGKTTRGKIDKRINIALFVRVRRPSGI